MPISVICSSCGKRLKAKDDHAGKSLPCPNCGQKVRVPEPDEESGGYLLQAETPTEQAQGTDTAHPKAEEEAVSPPTPKRVRPAPSREDVARLPPLTSNEPPPWLRHLHWLLVLALLPLAFSLLAKGQEEDIEKRIAESLEQLSPEASERIEQHLQQRKGDITIDTVISLLPEQKLAGAFLSRGTFAHWGFAAGSAVLFMAFFLLPSSRETAKPLQLLAFGFFTATIGIFLLLLLQLIASFSQGIWPRGGGILTLILYLVKLIGFCYQAAMDSENGFVLSFIGFTLGVGFCEEVCKALPLLWHYRQPSDQKWRQAFLWGLASGAGFGISEGIMYSASYYNGIQGPGIYLVRFLSCVALHALWTGSVAIRLNQNQGLIQAAESWYDYLFRLLLIVGIPMVLHGLYDTLLKKEMNGLALGVAILSFLYLAFQISRVHSEDDEQSRKALLREYKRRRAAMS